MQMNSYTFYTQYEAEDKQKKKQKKTLLFVAGRYAK